MTDRPYRGPAGWMRDNVFIFILAGVVAVAVIGDRFARSGLNPADDPRFAAGPATEAQPVAEQSEPAQQNAEMPPSDKADDAGATGGSSQESVTASPPAGSAGGDQNQKQRPAQVDTPERTE